MTYRQLIAFLLLPALLLSACVSNDDSTRRKAYIPFEALSHLNAAIGYAPTYRQQKEMHLDSIKQRIAVAGTPAEIARLSLALAREYRLFSADSAVHYAERALRLIPGDDRELRLSAELALANSLSTAGIFHPAMHLLDSISHLDISEETRIEYWKSSRVLYSYMMSYLSDHDSYHTAYRKKYLAADDSLLIHLPAKDDFYKFILCERLVTTGNLSEARTRLENLLNSLPEESNLYGMAAYQLAEVHKNKGDLRNYARYLALAAESDIKGGVMEGWALPTLAEWLYEHGDIDNASTYLNYALQEANQGNIRMRTISIAPLIPVIENSVQQREQAWRNHMRIYVIVVTTLLIASAAMLVITLVSNRKRQANEKKLAVTYRKIEGYVGNFIALCSSYSSRLEQLTKLVTRKINAGQTEELLKLISSGRYTEGDNEEYYRLIDKTLLDIFPDFVQSINRLLRPDKQIELKKDEPLSPELRIYAFVRLGVDQSSKIAQILGYSVNTVYAYRNRMRNRALNHDTFDVEVVSIK